MLHLLGGLLERRYVSDLFVCSFADYTWMSSYDNQLQILLGNAIGTAAFCVALYHFFSTRIEGKLAAFFVAIFVSIFVSRPN